MGTGLQRVLPTVTACCMLHNINLYGAGACEEEFLCNESFNQRKIMVMNILTCQALLVLRNISLLHLLYTTTVET